MCFHFPTLLSYWCLYKQVANLAISREKNHFSKKGGRMTESLNGLYFYFSTSPIGIIFWNKVANFTFLTRKILILSRWCQNQLTHCCVVRCTYLPIYTLYVVFFSFFKSLVFGKLVFFWWNDFKKCRKERTYEIWLWDAFISNVPK